MVHIAHQQCEKGATHHAKTQTTASTALMLLTGIAIGVGS